MTFRGRHPDELISASLTGDLTDAERAELDAHLARCETCRETLAAFGAERELTHHDDGHHRGRHGDARNNEG